jgi:hypothetical protein
METCTLTQEQIDNLFEFCEFHDVHYYDVQIELVDHFASSIEELWKTNPDLPFEEAVFQIGEQFGVDPLFHADYNSLLPSISGKQFIGESGFETIKNAKIYELRRKYERIQWKYIKEFFRLPKIILTITITLTLFCIFGITENDLKLKASLIILVLYIVFLTVFYPKKFRLTLIPGKSFLLYDHFKAWRKSIISVGLFPLSCSSVFINGQKFFTNCIFWELLSAFLITLFGIILVMITTYIPHRIKEDFIHEYPQFVNG